MQLSNLDVKVVNWKDIKQDVVKCNLEFANLVDDWDNAEKYKFYLASYHYGDKISDKGRLNLPLKKGGVVSLQHSSVPEELRKDLSYSSFPIGLILNHSAEVFREVGGRVSPLALFEPGVPLGLLETLEPLMSCCVRNAWDVLAGARSIFMLPKISDSIAHKRLQKETNISLPPPRGFFDHFYVFKEIYDSGNTKPWKVDILFLPQEWFKKTTNDIGHVKFDNFLHKYLFAFSGYSRNKPTLDLVWDCFCEDLIQRKKRIYPHIYDTVRHLFAMGCAAVPGFSPAINDESGPISDIQKIYSDIYDVGYVPTILIPKHFVLNKKKYQPVYYSINLPTRFRVMPRSREKATLAEDLYQIKLLIDSFYRSFYEKKLMIDNTWLEHVTNAIQFEYFHLDNNSPTSILDTAEMPKNDNYLLYYGNKVSRLPFNAASTFCRGCVRISKNEDIELVDSDNLPLS